MSKKSTVLIAALFVFSGITSLVYQTLWIRVLSLGVGSTSASISMVLSIFFFGLACGSYLTGRYANRIENPLLFYGILEGFIGLYSIGLIYFLLNFHNILALLPLSGSLSWFGVFWKFAIVWIVLFLPTICMGASLPLLVRVFVDKSENVGRYVSILYAVNTFGAVIGAFAASFFFIPKLGVLVANHSVACLNLLILVAAYFLSKKLTVQIPAAEKVVSTPSKLTTYQRSILLACGLTGFSSIAAEVTWNKYLGIFFGTNIYGLGLILSIFLLGIALGSLALSFVIDRIKNKRLLFMNLFLCSAVAVFLTSYLLNFAPLFSSVLSYYLSEVFNLLTIKSVVSALIMLPSTLIFGALFPLAINLLTESSDEAPRTVGTAYSINTVGSILGSYLAGIVFIPLIGSSASVRIAIVLLIFGVIVVALTSLKTRFQKGVYISLAAIFLVFVSSTGNVDFRNIIKSAYYQATHKGQTFSEIVKYFSRDYEEFKLIAEGETGIISLSHDRQDGENYKDFYRLKTNGLNESVYNRNDLRLLPKYEGLLGLLPYSLVRNPESAFVVGYGGGFTVDFLTQLDLKQVYVAELEAGILKAADYVYDGDNPILKRKNLDLRIEDARYVMAAKLAGPFDIIVSQPSHSWLSGVANLFTKEFFEIVKSNLTEKGVFSQWLNLYNMDKTVLKSIMRTFYTVFPHGVVFTDKNDQELIMIGSMKPVMMHFQKLAAMTNNPSLRSHLANVPFNDPYSFLTNYSISRKTVMNRTKGSVINTDINAYAEANQSALFYSTQDQRNEPQQYLSSIFGADYGEFITGIDTKSTEYLYNQAVSLATYQKYDKFHDVLESYETRVKDDPSQYERLGYLMLLVQRYATASKYLSEVMSSSPTPAALGYLGTALVQTNRYKELIELVASSKLEKSGLVECQLADSYIETAQTVKYATLFNKLAYKPTEYTKLCGDYYNKVMGKYFFTMADYKTSIPFMEAYYAAYSDDEGNLRRMIAAYLQIKDIANADSFTFYLQSVKAVNQAQAQGLIKFFEKQGYANDAKILKKIYK